MKSFEAQKPSHFFWLLPPYLPVMCQVPQTCPSFRRVVVVVIGHVPRSGAQIPALVVVVWYPLGRHFPVVCNFLIPKV